MANDTFEIKVEGLRSLQHALEVLPIKFSKQVVKPAIKNTMKEVVLPEALRTVPVVTGNLKRSLKVRVAKTAKGKRQPRGVIAFGVQTTKTKTRDGYYGLWVFTGATNRDGTKRVGSRTLRKALYGRQSQILAVATAKMRAGLPIAVAQARTAAAGKG